MEDTAPKGINSSQAEGLSRDDTLNRAEPPPAASAHRRSNPPSDGESLRSRNGDTRQKGLVSPLFYICHRISQEVTL